MIVLDTNVLSELMRDNPDVSFVRWIQAQDPASQFTTAVCEAEVLYGLSLLTPGRRRSALLKAADTVFARLTGRILPFDSRAAKAFAEIASARRQAGRPIGEADAQIAAIAFVYGGSVATRNVDDFNGCGVRVVSPWAAS